MNTSAFYVSASKRLFGMLSGLALIGSLSAQTTHQVTFEVNMANETVAPSGVFIAGGTYFGVPGDNPMTDLDGDGIYSITFELEEGFSGHYAFTNGACGDWGCKENLAGQPCGDSQNYNDRFIGPVMSDMTITTCFAGCSTDGSCSAFIEPVDVTFQVDMTMETISGGVFITGGSIDNWCGCTPLTDDDGDGIYSITLTMAQGAHEYKFLNGGWGGDEQFDPAVHGACTLTTGAFTNRLLMVNGADDIVLDAVCFNECVACEGDVLGCTDEAAVNYNPFATVDDGSCIFGTLGCMDDAAANYNGDATVDDGSCLYATFFNVDMNCVEEAFSTVHISGPFCGWCASEGYNDLLDDDGDGVYSGELWLPAGTTEYKYMVDNFAGQENLVDDMAAGASCAPITDFAGYANRLVEAGSTVNETYGSCTPCNPSAVLGCTDETAVNYDGAATQDDGSCLYVTTFNVDMSCADVAFTTVHITGPFCGWCGTTDYNTLSDDDGDGIYTGELWLPAGETEYKYMVDGFANQENLVDDMQNGATCAPVTDFNTYANRLVVGGSTVNETYGSCTECGTVVPTVVVDFAIDMNLSEYPNADFDNVVINGAWNNWNGWGVTLTDADGDGIFTGSAEFEENTNTEFVIAVTGPADGYSGWGAAINAPAECSSNPELPLGQGGGNYALNVGTENLSVAYCAGSCSATCPDPGCTDPFYVEFDPYATLDDGSCATLKVWGCIYDAASNYNPAANTDDGSCIIEATAACPGDLNNDGAVGTSDLLAFLSLFGLSCD